MDTETLRRFLYTNEGAKTVIIGSAEVNAMIRVFRENDRLRAELENNRPRPYMELHTREG